MIQSKLKDLSIVELVGITTSFLLITGISYFYAYYAAGLNAAWIINLITTKELLMSNLRLGVGILVAFMYLESIFENGDLGKQWGAFLAGCVIIICITILHYEINKNFIWTESISYLIILIAIFILIKLSMIYKLLAVLLIVFVAPFVNGLTAYYKKIESNLPEVNLKDDSKKWYLFDTFSDQAILIDSKNKEKNIKILPINDLENIRVK